MRTPVSLSQSYAFLGDIRLVTFCPWLCLDQLPLAPPASSLGSPLPSRIWPWLLHVCWGPRVSELLSCHPWWLLSSRPLWAQKADGALITSALQAGGGAAPCSQPGRDRVPELPWGSRDIGTVTSYPSLCRPQRDIGDMAMGWAAGFAQLRVLSPRSLGGGGHSKRVLRPELRAGPGAS